MADGSSRATPRRRPEVRALGPEDVQLITLIDRSEHVDVEYCVTDGVLTQRPVTIVDVPRWDVEGNGPFSVAHQIEFCSTVVRNGALLFGAFEGDELMGLAAVDPLFEPGMAWLAYLHVSRPARRRGAATALWNESARRGRDAGADRMYVSATPTGSAVGFYLRQGSQLARPPHSDLYAKEPDDIHLICPLT